jgi:exonuclease VII small subunit
MGHGDLLGAMQGNAVFDGLLAQCRDVACARLDQAVAGMLEKSDAAIEEILARTYDREAKKLYVEAQDVARRQRAEIAKSFRDAFLAEFRQRSIKGKKTGGSFDAVRSSFELSLVGDDDLDETLRFNEMAAKLRRICEEELNALDQRVGVLLGDAELESDASPLGPQAICDAYKKTCRKLVDSAAVRGVFLKLFDDHVLDEVRSIYKALNDLLVQNAILPKIRYGKAKKSEGKTPTGPKDKDGKTRAEDEPASEQDMFAALQKLFANQGGGGGGPGMGVGGGPMLSGAELLGSLTKLQLDGLAQLGAGGAPVTGTTNVLHELKGTAVGAGMGQMDAMTLDVVAMLFDQLFDDPKIPLGAKGLIGRMQIPMLKVAIADKELFSKKHHPARRLLDTMAEIAIRLPADFNVENKLFGHLETIIQGLVGGYEDDVGIFDIVREQLLALMAREDARIEQEAQAAAERVMQEEALAVAKGVAQEEIRARVVGKLGPGPVLEFLVEQWLKLMLIIHVKRGASSEAWRHALEAMDQLIWSVQPKDTPEERRQLATVVPPLLKRLGAGLEVAGVEHEVREFFFAELMKTHTRLMSAPLKARDEAPHAVPAAPALDFTASITVRNPYGGGEVKVSAAELPAGGDDVDDLKQGDWVEFKVEGEENRRPARLIFISPRKTRYIFSDRNEKDYIECTRSEIARRLRAGEAVIMEEEPAVPFFERIMGGVLSRMKGRGPATTRASL